MTGTETGAPESPKRAISRRGRGDAIIAAVVLLAAILVPIIAPSRFAINLVTEIALLGLWAVSLNILIGYTGLVSFGHAAFFGLGVYTTGLLIAKGGFGMLAALAGGVALAALVALAVGVIIVRLSGIAFALVTLAFSMMLFTVVWRWRYTGGDDGISVKRPALLLLEPQFRLDDPGAFFYFAIALVVIAALLLRRFVRSPVGAALQAIKQNPVRAQAVGIDVRRHKLIAFVVSGTVAGLAGSLYILFRGFAAPDLLHWSSSGQILLMTILGGTGTLFGPMLGAAVFVLLQEVLSTYTQYWMLPLGVLFILAVRFLHGGGLLGLLQSRGR